jgi:hypothetical protein
MDLENLRRLQVKADTYTEAVANTDTYCRGWGMGRVWLHCFRCDACILRTDLAAAAGEGRIPGCVACLAAGHHGLYHHLKQVPTCCLALQVIRVAPARAFPEHKIKWMEGERKPLLVAHPTAQELAAVAAAERRQREEEERRRAAADAAIAAAIAAATADKPEAPAPEDPSRTVSQDLHKILQQISSTDLFGDAAGPPAVKSSTGASASASSTSAGMQQPGSSGSLPGTTNAAAGGEASDEASDGPSSSAEPETRPLLPEWCTAGVEALSVISWSKGKELLEDSTWFDFFGADDAPKLLQLCGVSMQVSIFSKAVPNLVDTGHPGLCGTAA